MARKQAPKDVEKLFSLRLSNLTDETRNEPIVAKFSQYGPIGDFYRPKILAKSKPSRFAFVRYVNKDDADRALENLNGTEIDGCTIKVEHAEQHSFFTLDTGFITNSLLDTPFRNTDEFDSSMPSEHYELKRVEAIKDVDVVFGVKVEDIDIDISPEQLHELFRRIGEISSIYYPVDFKTHKRRGFAFVRYLRKRDAERAIELLHNVNIGKGRSISVSAEVIQTYFSQNETPVNMKQKKK